MKDNKSSLPKNEAADDKNTKKTAFGNNKKLHIIIAVAASILILSVFLAIFFNYQAPSSFNDRTESLSTPSGSSSSENTDDLLDDDSVAVLSQNVNSYYDDEAAKINSSILSITSVTSGVRLEIKNTDTTFDDLGIGDIFYLDGSADTPFGQVYIGKIAERKTEDGNIIYTVETPMVDEVFDRLDFGYEQQMTNANISSIDLADGVTVHQVDDVSSEFTSVSRDDSSVTVTTLGLGTASPANTQQLQSGGFSMEGLVFEFDYDLAEMIDGLFPSTDDEPGRLITNEEDSKSTKVFTTKTGECYHRESCFCLSRSKYETTLSEAVSSGYRSCKICKPPLREGEATIDANLNLSGKAGFTSIDFDCDFDWNILEGQGINTLRASAGGTFIAETCLDAGISLSLRGRTTEYELPGEWISFNGLNEKLFPLAYVTYNGTLTTLIMRGNEGIRTLTSAMPISVGVSLYIDINGNIACNATFELNVDAEFNYSANIVENGNWVWDIEESFTHHEAWGLDVECSADFDANLGISLQLYVFNLNIVDFAVVQFGAEGEGSLKFAASYDSDADEIITENEITYYARLYLKLLNFNVKLKTKIDFWLISESIDLNYSNTVADITLKEWGEKRSTAFNSDQMTWSHLTAKAYDTIYYKDSNGDLVAEKDNYKQVLYDGEFFSICCIDESYIYLLRSNSEESDKYDLFRIGRTDGTVRTIVEGIYAVIGTDDNCIYYLGGFDKNTILYFERGDLSLEEKSFCTFDYPVSDMAKTPEGDWYVTAENSDSFSWFFGPDCYYYLVGTDGNIKVSYGSSPDISQYLYIEFEDYKYAKKPISYGYLRNTAEEIYWVSSDNSKNVLTEPLNGWHPTEEGIYTVHGNSGGETSYKIVLYTAETGECIDIADVENSFSFFTLCKDSDGCYYFFDQDSEYLTLYTMDPSYGNKTVVKQFLLSEMPCDLEDCSTTIIDNKIFFYTMPNSTTSQVLYRYNIVD